VCPKIVFAAYAYKYPTARVSAARHGTHLYLRYRRRFPDQLAVFGVQIKDLLQLGLGNTAHGQRRRVRSPRALAGIEASVSVQVKKEKRIVDKGQGEGSGSLTLANLSKASTARHQRPICLAEKFPPWMQTCVPRKFPPEKPTPVGPTVFPMSNSFVIRVAHWQKPHNDEPPHIRVAHECAW
jgi:hypothetical protein